MQISQTKLGGELLPKRRHLVHLNAVKVRK